MPRPLLWMAALLGLGVGAVGLALLIAGYDESQSDVCRHGPAPVTFSVCRSSTFHEALGVLLLIAAIVVVVVALRSECRIMRPWKKAIATLFAIGGAVSLGVGLWVLVAAERHAGACAVGMSTTALVCTGGQVTGIVLLVAGVGFLAVELAVLGSEGRPGAARGRAPTEQVVSR